MGNLMGGSTGDKPESTKVVAPDGACEEAIAVFKDKFKSAPTIVVAAPGRVNMIGEHTDYQEGFVFPIALDRKCVIALAPTSKGYRIYSREVKDTLQVDTLPEQPQDGDVPWWSYVVGAMRIYCDAVKKPLPEGFDAVVLTTVPLGGGLSSSAAVEVASATAMEVAVGVSMAPMEKAVCCQKAEHEWAKMPCGLMDQAISCCGRAKHAMLLDCRSKQPSLVPMEADDIDVLIIDSAVRHALVDGAYSTRKNQCQKAVEIVQKKHPKVTMLRDVTLAMLEDAKAAGEIDDETFRRASHVVAENDRCLQFADKLKAKDWKAAGTLMYESHASLRDNFEVSTPEIDRIVELAREQPGAYGARITGGGFGGCVVCLVDKTKSDAVKDTVLAEYSKFLETVKASAEAGLKVDEPRAFLAEPSDGAHIYKTE